jgi:hypothetical protein
VERGYSIGLLPHWKKQRDAKKIIITGPEDVTTNWTQKGRRR